MTDSRQEQALVKTRSNGSLKNGNSNMATTPNNRNPDAAPPREANSQNSVMTSPQPGGGGATAAAGTSSSLQQQTIGTKPTLVEKAPMRFLIMDAPRQTNIPYYIREMKRHNVTHVVRVCEPTYLAGEFSNAGICLHEMEYKDGTSPSKELIMSWLRLVESTFYSGGPTATASTANSGGGGGDSGSAASSAGPPCIAVHCVAGLGRAPVMVAIALVEFAGMDPVEAVSFLRSKRRGAINEKQLLYLSGYKRMYSMNTADSGCSCTIL